MIHSYPAGDDGGPAKEPFELTEDQRLEIGTCLTRIGKGWTLRECCEDLARAIADPLTLRIQTLENDMAGARLLVEGKAKHIEELESKSAAWEIVAKKFCSMLE